MGLQESERAPGWYNRIVYEENEYDYSAAYFQVPVTVL